MLFRVTLKQMIVINLNCISIWIKVSGKGYTKGTQIYLNCQKRNHEHYNMVMGYWHGGG